MDRITRKELKQDKFALEVERTVEYVSEHRKSLIRYGVSGAAVLVLVIGFLAYSRHQQGARHEALSAALEIQQAAIGAPPNEFIRSYPTEQARNEAAKKAFGELAADYSGSDEAIISEYYLGTITASEGKTAEAEKWLKSVVNSGNANYASLAKLALAQIYKAEGKLGEGEALLRSLIDKPTDFVSKEQATIELADLIASSKPAEARKLLEPLRTERSAVSRVAIAKLGEMSAAQ
ncbi:MAG: tetratricopeptide repeat protein [Rhodospirillales bacterium]